MVCFHRLIEIPISIGPDPKDGKVEIKVNKPNSVIAQLCLPPTTGFARTNDRPLSAASISQAS
jgi:hypothetical protein